MTSETSTNTIKRKVKAHLPKDWLADLRILYRMTIETLKEIGRTGFIVNLAIISTMTVALTIFGSLLSSSWSLKSITDTIGNSVELSVYLKDSVAVDNAVASIKKVEHVDSIKVITKDAAWKSMKMQYQVADIDNPLPNTLHVKIDDPQNIEEVSNVINKMNIVESINYAKDLAKKIQMAVTVLHTMIVVVALVSALFTITIINNTIHLVIQSRKEEIEIMRLMGVSNWYIKTPLIFQGAIYGFLGTLIAIIPLNMFQTGILEKINSFCGVQTSIFALNFVILIMFIMAIGFGSIGSLMSIKKYLSV